MIRFATMTDLETMQKAQRELKSEIDTLSVTAQPKTPGLKRAKNAPEIDEARLKKLKLQFAALKMKIVAEEAKSAKAAK
jgi:hypothetical protein